MNTCHPIHLLALLVAALLPGMRTEAAVTYSHVLSEQDDSFYNESIQFTASALTLSASTPTFSTNFNALGDEVLNIEFKAPTGYKFSVLVPTTVSTPELLVDWALDSAGSFVDTGSIITPATVTFTNLAGLLSSPSLLDSEIRLTGEGGDYARFRASFGLTSGTSFSFDSIILSTAIPAGYNVDFSSFAPLSEGGAMMRATSYGVVSDPGQWLTLESVGSVPEPSRTLLLLGGLLGVSLRRRRVI
jgi:hypothetical protein